MMYLENLHPIKASRMCTEKAAFLTKDEAKRTAHSISKDSGQKLSVYQCRNCQCWHLTSLKEQG